MGGARRSDIATASPNLRWTDGRSEHRGEAPITIFSSSAAMCILPRPPAAELRRGQPAHSNAGYMADFLDLEAVVDFLDRRQLRATYGAVAEVVGRPATFLMSGIPRAPRYSWIVNQKTLLPTGYTEEQCHSALTKKSLVLRTGTDLRKWIERHGG